MRYITFHMLHHRYQPVSCLVPWLTLGWEWNSRESHLLPDMFPGTGAELLFNAGEPILITSCSRSGVLRENLIGTGAAVLLCPRYTHLSFVAHGYVHLRSLRLRSPTCFALTGVSLEHIRDQVLPLSELGLTPPPAEQVNEEGFMVLGHWLREQLSRISEQSQIFAQAIEKLYYGTPPAELQQCLGMSTRTFQRRLLTHVGVDARYFLRTARFQRTLRQLLSGAPPLDSLLDEGYCDQSHFIKSCHFFTRRSPRQLFTPEHKILNHYNPHINGLVGFL